MTKPTTKIKKLWKDKTGVSPIIAVILMVAITVVLAATIYVWVSGFGAGGGGGFAMSVSQTSTGENETFSVISVNGAASWDKINISQSAEKPSGNVSAGDRFTLEGDNSGETLTITDTAQGKVVVQKRIN